MTTKISSILFICEHGSAKSTVAAEHFNKLAGERNLPIQAISRGTNPDESFPENVIEGLQSGGLKVNAQKPKKLSQTDVANAVRIVVFCQLPAEYEKDFTVEDWSDVPPVSENYSKSRDEIVKRIKRILADVQ